MNMNFVESTLFKTHFDIIPFGIYVVDVKNYEIVFVNRFFRERFGDLMGCNCYKTLFGYDRICPFCKIGQLISEGGSPNAATINFDLYNETDERWYQMQERAITWPDGRVVKYSIAVDISELKETQNQLAEAHAELALKNDELIKRNEVLEENLRLREHVERITNHDLKTPLNVVINMPQLINSMNRDLSAEVKENLQIIHEAGLNMLSQINRTFDLYKMETGTYRPCPKPVKIYSLLERIVSDSKPLAFAGNINVVITADPETAAEDTPATPDGDELLLYSMFSNLLKNAIEASPYEGRVEIDLSVGEEVNITLINSGEVPEEIRERFFEKYVTSGKKHGTGLGTYSAMLIARVHKGSIYLDSSIPGKTIIRVTLPLRYREND